MLTLTDRAVQAIRDLMVGEYLPKKAGLRISALPGEAAGLEFSLVSAPSPGDEVLERSDVRVFLEPEAAGLLRDRTLDVHTGPGGRPTFQFTPES
ncbi:iron-sulfur cluster biosynthesis family protein [Microbispora corallina]|uniref:Iron-sulfur cluster biosynthesis protein n=1 Tax=Microbispora corallina TaxID=83302 RepID=A0ABQ4FW68_9ACTN|nr:Fe-S cluster assembly protein HesB [Microbispora corallina]GIH39068.1 iron-sulfur cluster biosynthesis protein [Microbispora corallina]